MSGKNRRERTNAWQSAYLNQTYTQNYMSWILTLAITRFKWQGLPDTVNTSILEQILCKQGAACLVNYEGAWLGLQVGQISDLDVYGFPTKWSAVALNGQMLQGYGIENSVLILNSMQPWRDLPSFWSNLLKFARQLADIDRLAELNRAVQKTPVMFHAPMEQKQIVYNYAKQLFGNEPAILTDDRFSDIQVDAINLGIDYVVDKIVTDRKNTWSELYAYLGIPHLAMEKNERLIAEEISATEPPDYLTMQSYLNGRRMYLEQFEDISGLHVEVVPAWKMLEANLNIIADEKGNEYGLDQLTESEQTDVFNVG